MKRPQDPRKHGLKEPKNLIYETRRSSVPVGDLPQDYSTKRCYIDTVVCLLEELRIKIKSENKTIINSPYLCFAGSGILIELKTEHINLNYAAEKAEYDAKIKEYEDDVSKFETQLLNKEKKIKESLDNQIVRLEHRLANLKASRNNQPLPFPND